MGSEQFPGGVGVVAGGRTVDAHVYKIITLVNKTSTCSKLLMLSA